MNSPSPVSQHRAFTGHKLKLLELFHSGFDIRQYISKRTCISLTMSIAFLSLIGGFLLGKSTSDRYHLIREHKRQNELLQRASLADSDIDDIEARLSGIVRAKLSTNFKDYYAEQYLLVNSQLQQNFTGCIADTAFNASRDDLEEFSRHLIRDQYNSFIKCADILKTFLQDIQ